MHLKIHNPCGSHSQNHPQGMYGFNWSNPFTLFLVYPKTYFQCLFPLNYHFKHYYDALKWYVPIAISIPHCSTGSSTLLVSNESPYFSHYNLKISASNSLYLKSYSRKCTYFRCIIFYVFS